MALQNIEANVTLDLYQHDTTPSTVKAIQLDSQTRYVAAMLQNVGVQYDVDSEAEVQLIVLRPDKVGVQITGTTFTYGDEGAQFLGPYAELTQVALAVSGKMRGQFKITSGTQILRTEIFTISAGVALDASTDEWAGEYDGYNLDELVEKVDAAVDKVDGMEADVSELKSGLSDVNELLNINPKTVTTISGHFSSYIRKVLFENVNFKKGMKYTVTFEFPEAVSVQGYGAINTDLGNPSYDYANVTFLDKQTASFEYIPDEDLTAYITARFNEEGEYTVTCRYGVEGGDDVITELKNDIANVESSANTKIGEVKGELAEIVKPTRNINTADLGRYKVNSSGVITQDKTQDTIFGMSEPVPCEPNMDYTAAVYGFDNLFDMRIAWYDAENAFISREVKDNAQTFTLTSPSNAKYIYVATYYSGHIPDIANGKIQIEKGTVSTPYVETYSPCDSVARADTEALKSKVTELSEVVRRAKKTVSSNFGAYARKTIFESVTLKKGYRYTVIFSFPEVSSVQGYGSISKLDNTTPDYISTPFLNKQVATLVYTPTEDITINITARFNEAGDYTVTCYISEDGKADEILSASDISMLLRNSVNTAYARDLPKRFAYHFGVSYYSGMVIPSQSVFDIQRAARLGFKTIEFNVQTTSDGALVVGHGENDNFGWAFYAIDGTDITETPFNSVTLDYIKTNIRQRSTKDKYKVAPLTLEEALLCAKNYGLVPYVANTTGARDIADAIMGKDNYILGSYTGDRPSDFSGTMSSWLAIAGKEQLLAKCNASGGAYVAGINVRNSVYADYTEADWKEVVTLLHDNGYKVSSAYIGNPNLQKTLFDAGFDYIFSEYQLNDFGVGSICNLDAGDTFADFTHSGTVTDGVLDLADGQTIQPSETYESCLGGGILDIRYEGIIKVALGKGLDGTVMVESDGNEMRRFSSYYNDTQATFKIASVGVTKIYSLSFKATA